MHAINFLTSWIRGAEFVIVAGAVCMVTYQALRKSTAVDSDTLADANVKIVNTIKGAIIAVTVGELISIVKVFYL